MKRLPFVPAALALIGLLFTNSAWLLAQSDQSDRIREATTVLEEIMGAPDKAVPRSVLARSFSLDPLDWRDL